MKDIDIFSVQVTTPKTKKTPKRLQAHEIKERGIYQEYNKNKKQNWFAILTDSCGDVLEVWHGEEGWRIDATSRHEFNNLLPCVTFQKIDAKLNIELVIK